MSQEKWDLMHMRWNTIHQIRGALPADKIIGYEIYGEEIHIFVCAYHETPDYFKDDGWLPVTIKDTWSGYYQCDRMGCEIGYYQEWMQEEEEKK